MKERNSDSKVKLSVNGLANIPIIPVRNDFEFIVGESHYPCASFLADFLSPKIARLHSVDPTIDKFIVSTKDSNGDFKSFISLGRGEEIRLHPTNRDFFSKLSFELGNCELYSLISDETENETTLANAISRLTGLDLFKCDSDFDFSKEIAFVASHFHEISQPNQKSEISRLDLSILSEILSSGELKLENEDGLLGFVFDLIGCISHCSRSFDLNICHRHRFIDSWNLRGISSIF
jgi:hypothetical protein